jgi:hypothetical protein
MASNHADAKGPKRRFDLPLAHSEYSSSNRPDEVFLNEDNKMPTTRDTDPKATTTAVVTLRIPHGTDTDLVTDAEARLSRADYLAGVVIDDIRNLDPQLSATTITVDITLTWTTTMDEHAMRERLTNVPGLESIRIENLC